MYATVLFLVAARACASCGDSALAPDPMFKTLFNALKTGVLEVSARYCASWVRNYRPYLSEESIIKFEGLLFDDSADAPQYGSGRIMLNLDEALAVNAKGQIEVYTNASPRNRASTKLQGALVEVMKGEMNEGTILLARRFAKYAFCKVWLHKELGPTESEMLRTIFSAWPEILQFINRLICARGRSGLLMAFADGWESEVVKDVWFELESQSSHVITTLVEDYTEDRGDPAKIPLDLFKNLTREHKYRLAMKLADLKPYCGEIDWHGFYILSRFSEHPSERIRSLCLEENLEFLTHEAEKPLKTDRPPTKLNSFDPNALPKEAWFQILLRLDEISQVYMALRVCKLWRKLGLEILNDPLAIQVAWSRDSNDPLKWDRILGDGHCEWNHRLGSRLTSFKCLLSQVNDEIEDMGRIRGTISTTWNLIFRGIAENKTSMSHESYLDLYVQCCRAIGFPLVFRQLPGMLSKEYAALIRRLVYQYDIVPNIPDVFFDECCEMFVKMLKKHGDLVVLLLRDNRCYYNKLVTHLFSAKASIPAGIEKILAEKSSLYRLLSSRRGNIGERLDIVPEDLAAQRYTPTVSQSVIDLCILLGPGSSSTALKLIEEAIIGHCCGPHASNETKCKQLKQLSIDILTFLCLNRKNYSIEELSTIERVLEECRVYGKDDDQDIFELHFISFLNDPQFIIKLIP